MHQSRTNTRFYLLLAAMLALGACGGGGEAGDESTADVAAETAEAEAAAAEAGEADADTDADADAPAAVESIAMPGWFPEDAYRPNEYSVVAAREIGGVQMVELKVDGKVEELMAQVRAGMQAQGWAQKMDLGETIGFTKAKRFANVTVNARDDGAARVSYQFSTL